MRHPHVYIVTCMHETGPIHTRDMNHSYMCHDSFIHEKKKYMSGLGEQAKPRSWRVMTRSYMWHQFVHVCDMTHSCEWHDSFIRVTWLIHVRDLAHTWLIHANESCHIYVCIYTCMYMYIHTYICIDMYVCTSRIFSHLIYLFIHVRVNLHTYLHTHIVLHTHAHMHTSIFVYACTYIYVYTYTCIIYTHKSIKKWPRCCSCFRCRNNRSLDA